MVHGERVVVITDIHGCLDDCRRLLDKMEFDKSRDRLINLGDTIDRGPRIYETFVFLRELKEEMGERCVLIRGNHEQMMLDATRKSLNRRNYKDLWYLNSGEKTVYSFISHKHKINEFRDWYEEMPYFYAEERFLCVHACLKNENPKKNSVETLIWGRDTDYTGKLVLTGHTPYRVPVYFCGKNSADPIAEGMWANLPEKGMIALDTGCVFGNRLSGLVIEDDRFKVLSIRSSVVQGG